MFPKNILGSFFFYQTFPSFDTAWIFVEFCEKQILCRLHFRYLYFANRTRLEAGYSYFRIIHISYLGAAVLIKSQHGGQIILLTRWSKLLPQDNFLALHKPNSSEMSLFYPLHHHMLSIALIKSR